MANTGSDQRLVAALLRGATRAEAAAEAGVSARTLRRRMGSPQFVRLLDQERTRVMSATSSALIAAGTRAVRRLDQLIGHDDPRVALSAVRVALGQSLRYREHVELELRSRMLEAAGEEVGPP